MLFLFHVVRYDHNITDLTEVESPRITTKGQHLNVYLSKPLKHNENSSDLLVNLQMMKTR